jgi:hypothetical protein
MTPGIQRRRQSAASAGKGVRATYVARENLVRAPPKSMTCIPWAGQQHVGGFEVAVGDANGVDGG